MIKLFAYLHLWLLISCGLLLPQSTVAETIAVAENQLKAAYLIHLSEFTTWPDAKMQFPYFSICLAMGSALSEPLEEIRNRSVKGKPLNIQYDVSVDKLNTCHILYIEEKNKKTFQQIQSKPDPILTVSSEAEFAKSGGIIEYYPDNDKIKMRVNLKAMSQANLMINPKLLRLMTTDF